MVNEKKGVPVAIKVTKRHHAVALRFANEVRAKLGKRPVKRLKKGQPGDGRSCTIARTIDPNRNVFVSEFFSSGGGLYAATGDERTTLLEKKTKLGLEFIRAFDDNQIPELDADL